MKCPTCMILKEESTVSGGYGLTTDMYWAPYSDEDGVEHHHDRNNTVSHYECSNGHKWRKVSYTECHCGWRHSEDRIIGLDKELNGQEFTISAEEKK